MLKELSEFFNSIKKGQAEMKVTLSEIKNNLQGINTRVDEPNNQVNGMEHKETKNNHAGQHKEKTIQKNKDTVRSLWDKQTNIHIIRVPEGKEKEQEIGNLFLKNNERKLP